MSEDGFHIHGPHDHELEHAAHHADHFSGKIAVITALLSTAGALFSYQASLTQNNAMMFKNEASIRKTEAADKWSYYQAKSNKQNITELALAIVSDDKKPFYSKEIERYKHEKENIKREAEKLEAAVSEFEALSEKNMHIHHKWALAMTMIQIAIALSAITLLTRKKWLEYMSYAVGGISVVLAIVAFLSS